MPEAELIPCEEPVFNSTQQFFAQIVEIRVKLVKSPTLFSFSADISFKLTMILTFLFN